MAGFPTFLSHERIGLRHLGPWTKFALGKTLERALIYLGATDEQMEEHRADMKQCGQGSSHIGLMPHRKNLLRLDWTKL
jgi:hypothetical protein